MAWQQALILKSILVKADFNHFRNMKCLISEISTKTDRFRMVLVRYCLRTINEKTHIVGEVQFYSANIYIFIFFRVFYANR